MDPSHQFISQVLNQALLLIIVVSGPPIIISMIVGIGISLFQAVTQIQEQTLTFVPKMLIIFGTLAALGPVLAEQLLRFTQMIFTEFPRYLH